MGPAYINYLGSLVYGTLTLVFLFQFFFRQGDRIAMLLTTLAAALAWLSCYIAIVSTAVAGVITMLAASLIVILLIFAIRTFLNDSR